jgi:hypothetical protein
LAGFVSFGRLVRHIPDKHFKMLRYAGLFSTRWRARYLEQARRALGHGEPTPCSGPEPSESPLSLRTWRERQAADTGADPLLCSHCGRSLEFWHLAFGPHRQIEALFQQSGRPVRASHPALAMPP